MKSRLAEADSNSCRLFTAIITPAAWVASMAPITSPSASTAYDSVLKRLSAGATAIRGQLIRQNAADAARQRGTGERGPPLILLKVVAPNNRVAERWLTPSCVPWAAGPRSPHPTDRGPPSVERVGFRPHRPSLTRTTHAETSALRRRPSDCQVPRNPNVLSDRELTGSPSAPAGAACRPPRALPGAGRPKLPPVVRHRPSRYRPVDDRSR